MRKKWKILLLALGIIIVALIIYQRYYAPSYHKEIVRTKLSSTLREMGFDQSQIKKMENLFSSKDGKKLLEIATDIYALIPSKPKELKKERDITIKESLVILADYTYLYSALHRKELIRIVLGERVSRWIHTYFPEEEHQNRLERVLAQFTCDPLLLYLILSLQEGIEVIPLEISEAKPKKGAEKEDEMPIMPPGTSIFTQFVSFVPYIVDLSNLVIVDVFSKKEIYFVDYGINYYPLAPCLVGPFSHSNYLIVDSTHLELVGDLDSLMPSHCIYVPIKVRILNNSSMSGIIWNNISGCYYWFELVFKEDFKEIVTTEDINIAGKLKLESLEKAVKKDSNSAFILGNLGSVYADARENEKAIAVLKRAIQLDSTSSSFSPLAYYNLALVMTRQASHHAVQQDYYLEIEKYLQRAITIDSLYANAYSLLGNSYLIDVGKFEPLPHTGFEDKINKAVTAFNKAIQLTDSLDACPYFGLAEIYRVRRELQKAEELIKKALEISPDEELYIEKLKKIKENKEMLKERLQKLEGGLDKPKVIMV